jgi:hypothetical protein
MNSSNQSKSLATCVRLSRVTRNLLAKQGSKDQTFDDIINQLMTSQVKDSQVVIDGESGGNSL